MNSAFVYRFADSYTRYPGGRLKVHGPFSGEAFREEVLLPLLNQHERVCIDLTDAAGYGASFLDESFGELGKLFGFDACRKKVDLVCNDDPTLVALIWNKIQKAASSQ